MKLACIFMASGYGKRFGENKLLATIKEKTLAEYVWEQFPSELFTDIIVVTEYKQLKQIAEKRGYRVIGNPSGKDDVSITIRLGVEALLEETEGCLFSVCDQPFIKKNSIVRMKKVFEENKNHIVALGWRGKKGNPVIFPRELFSELQKLDCDKSGSAVILNHTSLLKIVEATEERELQDIDRKEDLFLF